MPWRPPFWGGMSSPVLFQIIGIRRSGNHAIIDWLRSMYARSAHYNNLRHDVLLTETGQEILAELAQLDCLVCSFEDFPKRRTPGVPLAKSVRLLPPGAAPHGARVETFYIVRDAYNLAASLLKAEMAAGPDDMAIFIRDWLALAEIARREPERCIFYNRWFDSEPYRRQLAARLGVAYCDHTLGAVANEAGGSSFDGLPLPPLREMATNYRKYLSAKFLTRLRKRPLHYVRRILQPKLDARGLAVDQRWRYLAERPEAGALLANAAVREANSDLFGFHLVGDRRAGLQIEPARKHAPT